VKLTNSIHVRGLFDLFVVDRADQEIKSLQSLVLGLVIYVYPTLNHVSIVPLFRHNQDTRVSEEDQALIHHTRVLAEDVFELLNNFMFQ
jgi:hypothetical protein